MKKYGFTLAEVLITLGIIGVVAALTMPTFTAKTQTAKIGPALSKASSAFSESMKAMFAHFEADSISGMEICDTGDLTCTSDYKHTLFIGGAAAHSHSSTERLWKTMANFMNGSEIKCNTSTNNCPSNTTFFQNNSWAFQASDGIMYQFYGFGNENAYNLNSSPNKTIFRRTSSGDNDYMIIDINGAKEPNKIGRDQFLFYMLDNGTLLPVGSSSSLVATIQNNQTWIDNCPKDAIPTDEKYCTGHIFENGLKVEYK